jgi:type IV secretory pathway protease TraF
MARGPTGRARYPGSPIDAPDRAADHAGMEVIQSAQAARRPSIAPLLAGTIVGTIMIVVGIVLAYIAFATPALSTVMPQGRLNVGQAATGIVVWAIALVAPAAMVLFGASRLVRILARMRGRLPRRSATLKALNGVPEDIVVATGIALPDGRTVSDLVIGPFGAAVIRELPSAKYSRIREGRWEARTGRGWIRLENPLERASRDAERVRRWFGHDDADFVVKVYAAVVGPVEMVKRTPDCAVLAPDEVVPWISALPPQRSLTEGRRAQVVEQVRAAATD